MALTDEQIAENFTKWKAKRYKHGFPHHLESYLLTYLSSCSWYTAKNGLERVKQKQRILRIIRRSSAQNAAVTKKRKRAQAARETEKAKQKSFDF